MTDDRASLDPLIEGLMVGWPWPTSRDIDYRSIDWARWLELEAAAVRDGYLPDGWAEFDVSTSRAAVERCQKVLLSARPETAVVAHAWHRLRSGRAGVSCQGAARTVDLDAWNRSRGELGGNVLSSQFSGVGEITQYCEWWLGRAWCFVSYQNDLVDGGRVPDVMGDLSALRLLRARMSQLVPLVYSLEWVRDVVYGGGGVPSDWFSWQEFELQMLLFPRVVEWIDVYSARAAGTEFGGRAARRACNRAKHRLTKGVWVRLFPLMGAIFDLSRMEREQGSL